MSNSHNYLQSSLPIYRFLCELQTHGLQTNLSFNWGSISRAYKFYPRVVHQNIILKAASWKLVREDFGHLLGRKVDELPTIIRDFCREWNLPQCFCLVNGDLELKVNRENPLQIRVWLDTIKNLPTIHLREFLFDEDSAVTDKKGGIYTHQLLASLINQETVYEGFNAKVKGEHLGISVVPEFGPGSEWVYYKFYCGIHSADRVLSECIKPLIEELMEIKVINQWFFVRYGDPEWHIRLRLHLADTTQLGFILQRAKSWIQQFEDSGLIWKVQLDTYQRELKRYGSRTIEQAEWFFCDDSITVINLLPLLQEQEYEDIRWSYAVWLADNWMRRFQLSLEEKLLLVNKLKDCFFEEFQMTKEQRLQLDKKFRAKRSKINKILEESAYISSPSNSAYTFGDSKLKDTSGLVNYILGLDEDGKLEVTLTAFISSMIHMSLNRLLPANQRMHEMVVYYFLYKYYRSKLAQNQFLNPIC